jgi:hypothetical protein
MKMDDAVHQSMIGTLNKYDRNGRMTTFLFSPMKSLAVSIIAAPREIAFHMQQMHTMKINVRIANRIMTPNATL